MIDRIIRLLASPRGFLAFVAGYLALLLVLRVGIVAATGGDDAEQLLFSQVWALNYGLGNPPLYTWLVIAAQQVFGVSILAVAAVKFLLLFLLFALGRACARRLIADPRLAAWAGLAPLALTYIGWESVLGYSHTVLLATAGLATLWALLRLAEAPDPARWLMLGAVAGIGLMAKYNYALLLLTLLAAAMADPALRRILWSPWLAAAAGLAVAIFAPHGLWMLTHAAELSAHADDKFAVATVGSLAAAARGLWESLQAILSFVLPLAAIVPLCFPSVLRRQPARAPQDGTVDWQRVLSRHLLLLTAVLLIGVVALELTRVRTHYMAVLILFPMWLFMRVAVAGPSERAHRRYAAVLAILVALVPTVLAGKITLFDPRYDDKAYLNVPMAELAAALRAEGFAGGTVLAFWHPYAIAGNLRPYFPEARVVSLKHPSFVPPRRATGAGPERCLVIWNPEGKPWLQNVMIVHAGTILGADLTDAPVRTLALPLYLAPDRTVRFDYVLAEAQGRCG